MGLDVANTFLANTKFRNHLRASFSYWDQKASKVTVHKVYNILIQTLLKAYKIQMPLSWSIRDRGEETKAI